ncbi:hypothetical protein ASZ90_009103 [hydrocarbon metagenome]|uniref:Uncharacterized protein n=1 Tax=hydrocarbon metagenome TaxID=938273 RepID=A0A0W8FJS7_9ZZZZ
MKPCLLSSPLFSSLLLSGTHVVSHEPHESGGTGIQDEYGR